MASITTDIVDAYVFRHRHGRAQFLLLAPPSRAAARQYLAWHPRSRLRWRNVAGGRTTRDSHSDRARQPEAFSADYINQFFDHATDTIVLAPVFAFQLLDDMPISLDDEFDDYAWCDRDEATGRLIFAGQRWAVRHIEDIVANPVADSDFYRLP